MKRVAIEETDFWQEMQSNRGGNLLSSAGLGANLSQSQLAERRIRKIRGHAKNAAYNVIKYSALDGIGVRATLLTGNEVETIEDRLLFYLQRRSDPKIPHVSTAIILKKERKSSATFKGLVISLYNFNLKIGLTIGSFFVTL